MTYLTDLTTSRDALLTKLATESANPRPNYSVDGRSFTWDDYRSSLINQIEQLNKMIIRAGGAQEITTQVFG